MSWQITGMGWVCRLRHPAAPAAAAPIASRLGGEGGQPGTHLLRQPQQPLHAVETALQHVRLTVSSSNQKHTTDTFETHTFGLKVVGIFPCSVHPDDDFNVSDYLLKAIHLFSLSGLFSSVHIMSTNKSWFYLGVISALLARLMASCCSQFSKKSPPCYWPRNGPTHYSPAFCSAHVTD